MNGSLLERIAESDATFSRQGESWVGKCIICNGPIRFDRATGEGATIEHIMPRSLGGENTLLNLGIAHARCNAEKGRRWDPKRRHRAKRDAYHVLTNRILAERARRYRPAANAMEGSARQ